MSLADTVSKWVKIDNRIQQLNAEMKQLRNDKNNLECILTNYAKKNNIENSSIRIDNNKIKFSVTKSSEPITFKYLETKLCNLITNETQLQKTIDYLKENRQVKYNYSVKQINK